MDSEVHLLWFLGKAHEVFSYGLLTAIVCVSTGLLSFQDLLSAAFAPQFPVDVFKFYLFWASALFLVVSVICAYATKYADAGEGLLFSSGSIVVIMFGHIFEDCLGAVLSPFWFLADLFRRSMDYWKVIDYCFYFALIGFITVNITLLALS